MRLYRPVDKWSLPTMVQLDFSQIGIGVAVGYVVFKLLNRPAAQSCAEGAAPSSSGSGSSLDVVNAGVGGLISFSGISSDVFAALLSARCRAAGSEPVNP